MGLILKMASAVRVLVNKELSGLDRTDCPPPCRNDAILTIAFANILNIWLPAISSGSTGSARKVTSAILFSVRPVS